MEQARIEQAPNGSLLTYIISADALVNKAGIALKACFYFRGKKKKIVQKNEHGNICFLINYKFLFKISFKIISFFVSLVTLCDFFYSIFKHFLALMFFTK